MFSFSMRFFLKAQKRFDGTLFVREFYEFGNPGDMGEPGRVPKYIVGIIDDNIKANFPNEYKTFHGYVETHAEELYSLAKEKYPEEIDIDEFEKSKKSLINGVHEEEKRNG